MPFYIFEQCIGILRCTRYHRIWHNVCAADSLASYPLRAALVATDSLEIVAKYARVVGAPPHYLCNRLLVAAFIDAPKLPAAQRYPVYCLVLHVGGDMPLSPWSYVRIGPDSVVISEIHRFAHSSASPL
jgi:hypothetical protein